MMKTTSAFLAIILCFVPAEAHPGTALVIDGSTNVYFSYWGGTWKIDAKGHAERFHAADFHFLAIDKTGAFARSKLPDALRITPDGTTPALFSFAENPSTFHTDGNLYVSTWAVGRIRVERIKPDGSKSVFVDAAIDPRLARKPGKHEGGVLTIASGPNGFLLVSDGGSIWKIDSRGTVSSLAKNITVPNCASDLPTELPKPHIRGLAVDITSDVYAAAIGCRAVLRISAAGRVTPVLRSENPWSPCAVTVANGDLYVMEYDNTLAERPTDGRPRVRKIARDGKITTLITAEKAKSNRSYP